MSALRSAHEALGASFGEVAGAEVPRRYADSREEYRAVREAVGIVDRADLAVLRLWGRDPVRMLQGLITNDLSGAPAGQGVYAAMLTPKGKTVAELRAFPRERPEGREVLVALPREALEGTRAHLQKFVPPMFARWADVSEEVGVVGVYGPRSRELLGRVLDAEIPEMPEDGFGELAWRCTSCTGLHGTEPLLAVRTGEAGGEEGFDLVASAAALPALWDALLAQGGDLGARPVGFGVLEALRVEAGRPRYGRELTEETIPTEAYESTGLMERAISFHKGCYTGQEVIVRIAHRGHVNRLLRGFLLGDAPAAATGTPLFHPESGKQVGWITSSIHSPQMGQTVALGYARRELGPGDRVRIGADDGPEVEITALPF
jgi:folate-binding protein YgfZ